MTKRDIRQQYVSDPAKTGNTPRDLRTRAKRPPLPKSTAGGIKKIGVRPEELQMIEDMMKSQKAKLSMADARGMNESTYLKAQELARKYGVTWPKWGTKGDVTGYLGDVIRVCAQSGLLDADYGYYVAMSLKFLTPANVNRKALAWFVYWMSETWHDFGEGIENNKAMDQYGLPTTVQFRSLVKDIRLHR